MLSLYILWKKNNVYFSQLHLKLEVQDLVVICS